MSSGLYEVSWEMVRCADAVTMEFVSTSDTVEEPYRSVYGAFTNLRHQLGRCDDGPWYRHTFSHTDFAVDVQESLRSNSDSRHRP